MVTQARLRASTTVLIATIAVVVALTPLFAGDGSAAGPTSADINVVAIDANATGNSARTVGTIEDCISATVDQPVEIDIVVPGPGIPSNRGMAAYQFSILYDPAVVWIDADDSDMLLAQATGSNVIPIADPKPDRNGVYQSWGIDFGPSGKETDDPPGASEVGPGVIARITLLPKSEGVSALNLSGVLIIDDDSERISLESVESAIIRVGEPCTEPAQQTTPTPDDGESADGGASADSGANADSGASADSGDNAYSGTSDVAAATAAPSLESPSAVPTGGAAPPPTGGISAGLVVSGLIATLAGAALLVAGRLVFTGQARR